MCYTNRRSCHNEMTVLFDLLNNKSSLLIEPMHADTHHYYWLGILGGKRIQGWALSHH